MPYTKKALVVGINYTGSSSQLNGCVNDANNLNQLLQTYFQYSETDITLMTDDKTGVNYPSHANITQKIESLANDSENLSEIWISFSGHGSYVNDNNNDESDNNDEVLVPIDYKESGFISDDWLFANFFQKISENCKIQQVSF